MPERGSSAGAVLEALGFAVFVRDYSGALRLERTARCSRPALSGRLMLRHGDRAPWLQRESVETVLRCSRPR